MLAEYEAHPVEAGGNHAGHLVGNIDHLGVLAGADLDWLRGGTHRHVS
jgi:hypothetical protein